MDVCQVRREIYIYICIKDGRLLLLLCVPRACTKLPVKTTTIKLKLRIPREF